MRKSLREMQYDALVMELATLYQDVLVSHGYLQAHPQSALQFAASHAAHETVMALGLQPPEPDIVEVVAERIVRESEQS